MTRKIRNTVYLEATPDAPCELCGKVAELRPYGPKGENVCFSCGMLDKKAATAAFARLVSGPGETAN